jgi:HEAT repeat protein
MFSDYLLPLRESIANLQEGRVDEVSFRRVMDAFSSDDEFARAGAAAGIGVAFKNLSAAQQDEVVDRLATVLWKDKNAVRREALISVERIGGGASRTLPGLFRCLGETDKEVSYLAADAIASMGPDACAAVPMLKELLQKRLRPNLITTRLQGSVLSALGRLGPCSESAISTIEGYLGEKDDKIRIAAALAMIEIGGDVAHAVAVMKEVAESAELDSRRRLFWKLKESNHGLRFLNDVAAIGIRDQDQDVRGAAAALSRRIDALNEGNAKNVK